MDIEIFTKLWDYFTKLNNASETSKNINKNKDKGEAILISHICYLSQQGHRNNYLLTSDKNCLRALNNSGFTDLIEHLNGKVWCLEQLILKYIEEFGFDIIQPKIYPVRDCDMNIKMIFGYSIQELEGAVKESLEKEIAGLRQDTCSLLYASLSLSQLLVTKHSILKVKPPHTQGYFIPSYPWGKSSVLMVGRF